MAQKNMKQIIDQLRSSGYQVKAYKRKDGGYLIKEINGAKFTGAKGNTAARQIVGASLSVRRQKQLKQITPETQKAKKARKAGKPRTTPLPEGVAKEIREIQRLFRKNVSQLGDYVTIKTSSVRWILEHEGEEKMRQALTKARRYAEGYAYEESVDNLVERIEAVRNQKTGEAYKYVDEVVEKIKEKKPIFLEEWINQVFQALYNLKTNKAQDAKTFRDTVFRIIGA